VQLEDAFAFESRRLTFPMNLGANEVRDLVAMGPNYRHDPPGGRAMDGVTADFLIVTARPR
jgi:hypothetical protein